MKTIIALLALTVFATAQDIEPVPAEKIAGIADKLTAVLGSPKDAPFATETDKDKAAGLHAGKAGLLVMPEKKLTAEGLAAVSKEPVAIGQLWMHQVVPAVQNAAPTNDKLRSFTISEGDKDARVDLYYLGATKSETGALELSLFAKDKTPLVKVPLVKTDAAANTTPVALAAHKEGENTGVLVITLFGSYKADVTITKPQE
jgi:hypothetical protein